MTKTLKTQAKKYSRIVFVANKIKVKKSLGRGEVLKLEIATSRSCYDSSFKIFLQTSANGGKLK